MPKRHRQQRHLVAPTSEAKAWLVDDYPEPLKLRILLASRGAVHGPRRCLVCGKPGHGTRVFIPGEAMRIDQPEMSGITAYWLCKAHSAAPPADAELPTLLAARRRTRRG